MMNKYAQICLLLFALTACEKQPRTTAELMRKGPDNIGIDGYSPVSYFSRGRAEKGSPEFAVVHDGLTYWFTDASQVSAFESDPQRYVPAHGGWCSLMLTGSGNLAVANPATFKIVNDRLLLFWSGEFQEQAINGRRNWESKYASEEEERKLLSRADRTWRDLLSGAQKETVVFFNPEDASRVNDERRANGKKMYD